MNTVTVEPAPEKSTSGQTLVIEKHPRFWQCGDQAIQMGLTDDQLAYAYARFKQEGILEVLCYEYSLSLYEFMTLFLDEKTHTLGAFWRNPAGVWELQGFGFVRDIRCLGRTCYKACDVGEAFFRGGLENASPTRFAQLMLEYAFDEHGVSVVTGITPVKNRAACIFPRKLGFTMVGPLPGGTVWHGELCDVMISSMTMDMWEKHSPFDFGNKRKRLDNSLQWQNLEKDLSDIGAK